MLIARISGKAEEIIASAVRLARHGSVGMLLVDGHDAAPEDLRRAARNVILCELRSDADSSPPSPWASAIVYDICDPGRAAANAKQCALPVIAWRPSQERTSPATARAACDALQRDLAEYGDFAGYCV